MSDLTVHLARLFNLRKTMIDLNKSKLKFVCLALIVIPVIIVTGYRLYVTTFATDPSTGWPDPGNFQLPFKPNYAALGPNPPTHRINIISPASNSPLTIGKKPMEWMVVVTVVIDSPDIAVLQSPPVLVQVYVDRQREARKESHPKPLPPGTDNSDSIKFQMPKTRSVLRSTHLKLAGYSKGVYEYRGSLVSTPPGDFNLSAETLYRVSSNVPNAAPVLQATSVTRTIHVKR